MATQGDVAGHLDLTRQAVADLIARNILPNADQGQLDLDACRVAYVRHLREQAAGRAGGDLQKWRAEHAKEQALAARRKNELAAGSIIPMEQAIAARQEAIGHCRAKLLSIPTKSAPILAPITEPAVIKERLTGYIDDCLSELSRTSYTTGADRPGGGDGGSLGSNGSGSGNASGVDMGTPA